MQQQQLHHATKLSTLRPLRRAPHTITLKRWNVKHGCSLFGAVDVSTWLSPLQPWIREQYFFPLLLNSMELTLSGSTGSALAWYSEGRVFAPHLLQQILWFVASIALCNTWSSGGTALCWVGGNYQSIGSTVSDDIVRTLSDQKNVRITDSSW